MMLEAGGGIFPFAQWHRDVYVKEYIMVLTKMFIKIAAPELIIKIESSEQSWMIILMISFLTNYHFIFYLFIFLIIFLKFLLFW